VALFTVASFLVFVPAVKRTMMTEKREMIRELTNSAWNILANLHAEAEAGVMSPEEARKQAILQIRNLHYGPHMKDYFWVNDMHPRMIAHPYRPDLEGTDLSSLRDPEGTAVFLEFVKVVRRDGAGFVHYMWQRQDDPTHVVPKLSYVRGFEPWGWIIGTGIYIEDVKQETRRLTRHLVSVSLVILGTVSVLLLIIVMQALATERRRQAAEQAMLRSEERYRSLVESAGENIIMSVPGEGLYANARALHELGYSAAEFAELTLDNLIVWTDRDAPPSPEPDAEPTRCEAELRRRDGGLFPAVLTTSAISIAGRQGIAIVASDISEQKQQNERRERSESRLRQRVQRLESVETRQREDLERLKTALMLLEHPISENTPAHLLDSIRNAAAPEDIATLNQRLPALVRVLVDNGYKAENINRFITVNTDLIVRSFVDAAVAELGPPPAEFALLILGSEGRREQTLCTDQDNAIVYATPQDRDEAEVKTYFLRLAEKVCTWLDDAGYHYCKGNMMAQNPTWNRSLDQWEELFSTWIRQLEAEDLLQCKIFFDFRCAYGDKALVDRLRDSLGEYLMTHPRFFPQLAQDILGYAPPLGIFGAIQLETLDDGRRAFDIKSAMTPIVDAARIYALQNRIEATNTLERLQALADAGVLPARNCDEISQVYSSLMQIRIQHQVDALAQDRQPDNFVDPDELTLIDKRVLKEAFAQIKHLQTALAYHFTGMPGRIS
jgi:PAS domain S-box-containing protein